MGVPQDWLGCLPQLRMLRIQTCHFCCKVITSELTADFLLSSHEDISRHIWNQIYQNCIIIIALEEVLI